ncbi:MAG: glycosyltransferase, partial [Promethearchaeota archaeon]
MNILLISHFFPPHKGGVETASYNTAKILSKLGHNVVVLTSKIKLEKRKLHKMDGFLVYRLRAFNPPEFKLMPQISSFGFIPLSIFKLLKIIKKHKIHLIHAQGRFFPISFISAIINKLTFKLPMVITVQGRLKIGVTGLFENIFDF